MSGPTVTSTDTIYIPLLHEGIEVYRPTAGLRLRENIYQVLPTEHYGSDDECWQFVPGSVVECAMEFRNGQEILIAKKRSS
jgi:hypothetical protein